MAIQGRFVDTLPPPERTDNVQVLAVGLSRTGTMSMFYALRKLGYKSYHMLEACGMTRKGHLAMWTEAVAAKYPRASPSTLSSSPSSPSPFLSPAPAPYTSTDFHKLLQDYEALADIPSIHFVPELLEAYPNAKLVLTTHPRGPDAWLRSMDNCFFRINAWRVWDWPLMAHDPRFTLPYISLLRRSMELWSGLEWPAAGEFGLAEPRLRETYEAHNEEMRRLAREYDRPLLEFDPKQGWAPLCEFLGKEVPEGKYPHANEGNYVVNLNRYVVAQRFKATYGGRFLMVVGGLTAVGLAWWWAVR